VPHPSVVERGPCPVTDEEQFEQPRGSKPHLYRYNGMTSSGSSSFPKIKKTNRMSMKTKAAILVSSFAVLLFVVVGSMGDVHASSNDGAYRQLKVYRVVLSRVRSEYVEEPNIQNVTYGALHGRFESLDSICIYL